jgi:hypothetical protein
LLKLGDTDYPFQRGVTQLLLRYPKELKRHKLSNLTTEHPECLLQSMLLLGLRL